MNFIGRSEQLVALEMKRCLGTTFAGNLPVPYAMRSPD